MLRNFAINSQQNLAKYLLRHHRSTFKPTASQRASLPLPQECLPKQGSFKKTLPMCSAFPYGKISTSEVNNPVVLTSRSLAINDQKKEAQGQLRQAKQDLLNNKIQLMIDKVNDPTDPGARNWLVEQGRRYKALYFGLEAPQYKDLYEEALEAIQIKSNQTWRRSLETRTEKQLLLASRPSFQSRCESILPEKPIRKKSTACRRDAAFAFENASSIIGSIGRKCLRSGRVL